jgi:hypothetical protein
MSSSWTEPGQLTTDAILLQACDFRAIEITMQTRKYIGSLGNLCS